MNVLVVCEKSGTVRRAFRDLGHNAWSLDILPPADKSPYHVIGDAMENLGQPGARNLDLIIMHPPCTALCYSGNAHYAKGKPNYHLRQAAEVKTMALWKRATNICNMVAMENPRGTIPMKPTQTIQPYEFGHPEAKATNLWLHGLPKLEPTNQLPLPESGIWSNQTRGRQNNLGQRSKRYGLADRSSIRSQTYQGIADAMAIQWSDYASVMMRSYLYMNIGELCPTQE